MSHSTHVGFSAPVAGEGDTARPSKLFTGTFPMEDPSFQSRLVGVGHIRSGATAPSSIGYRFPPFPFW